jgi:hypothetical protein
MNDDTPDPARLHKRWLHSYEEDTETEAVYRPESYAFPPSRGPRPGFELRPDGSCILLAESRRRTRRRRKPGDGT